MSEKNAVDTCPEHTAAQELIATNRMLQLDEHLYQRCVKATDLNPLYHPPVRSVDTSQLRVEIEMWRELGYGEEC
jgi:hypothetical protein